MIDNFIRERLPPFVSPLLKLYKRWNVHPCTLSLLGLAVTVVSAFAIVQGFFVTALFLWYLSRIFDGTDGLWARESGRESAFGSYLDFVCDMTAYSLIVVAFYVRIPELTPYWMAMLFLYIVCTTSALTLGSQEQRLGLSPRDNRGLRLGAGLAEAGETSIAYTLLFLFPQFMKPIATGWLLVLGLTVILRTLLAYKTLPR